MTTPARSSLRARLAGLVATLAVLAILAGLPAVLLAVGGIPDEWPTPGNILGSLTRPDDGTLAVTAFVVLGWLVWIVLAGSIVTEVAAALRGRTVRALPGLALPQGAAKVLVAAAALLFVSTPLTTTAASAAGMTPTTTASSVLSQRTAGVPARSDAADTRAAVHGSVAHGPDTRHAPALRAGATATGTMESAGAARHLVQRGDSLWSIAETHLGSGRRYPEIAALNRDILGNRPDFLLPGTALRLPTPIAAPAATTPLPGDATGHLHVVQPGDTLSEIAAETLGDPNRYPEIFQASRDRPQPGGARLTDPDIIDIGWTITIPDTAPTTTNGKAKDKQSQLGGSPLADNTAAKPNNEGAGTRSDATPSGTEAERPGTPGNHVGTAPAAANPAAPAPAPTPGSASASTPRPPLPASAKTEKPKTDRGESAAVPNTAGVDGSVTPSWLLTGLAGGGGVLAGSLFLVLRSRRRAQFRARRPGRTIAVPGPELASVEKTITVTGEPAAVTVEWLDEVLRRLGAAQTDAGKPMPQLAAIELGATGLTLHLSQEQDASQPWQAASDLRRWHLATSTDLDSVGPKVPDQPAPYPLLVTVGTADSGETWLLNCELLTPMTITGDPTYAQDLARYVAAELACNPWSYCVTVRCMGLAEELVALNPVRICAETATPATAKTALADATDILRRVSETGLDVPTARVVQADDDIWAATLLLLDASAAQEATVEQLQSLIADNPGMTATSVVHTSHARAASGVEVHVTEAGRVIVPAVGLDLIAVGLTPDEAKGCAALLAQADTEGDTVMPTDPDAEGWRGLANEAGALREEHTLTRDAREALAVAEARPTSILDLRDEDYLDVAATTSDDLETLAPAVSAATRDLVEDADPDLDRDLQTWSSDTCDLPRLTLLGPVRARTRGIALTKRKPYYTELLAFLATRPHGATPDEVAEAFSLTPARARNDVKIVRDWLGTNPRTGHKHLPDAREAPAAKARGGGVYQVEDVLSDIDLFKRLRLRGEARGTDGIADLRRALTLVGGRPFDRLRPAGWSWLLEGDRLDHHMTCAVVDVAHLVATTSIQAGDHRTARAAAELACLAAPYEEIPRLDLAAVAAAEGHHQEAERIAREEVCNRTDEPGPPTDLSDRTARILQQHQWLRSSHAAS